MGSVQGKVLDGISRTFADDDAVRGDARAGGASTPEALGLKQSHLAVDQHATASLQKRLEAQLSATHGHRRVRRDAPPRAELRAASNLGGGGTRRETKTKTHGSGRVRVGAASTASGVKHAESGTRSDGSEDEEDTPDSVPGTDDLLSLLVVLVARETGARCLWRRTWMGFTRWWGRGTRVSWGSRWRISRRVQYVRSEQMRELLARWEGKGEAEAGEQPASPGSPHAIA